MFDPKALEAFGQKMNALIADSPLADAEKNTKAMLKSLLSRMDLVTREEFDIQAQVLAKTREKLTALEKKVAELEGAREATEPEAD